VLRGDLFGVVERDGQTLPMDDVVLVAPFESVRLVNIMGGFLRPGETLPPGSEPMWLPKACNYVSGDGGEIQVPSALKGPVQMEAELAVVVGRPLRKASAEEAGRAIFGWSVFNDVTAPEYGAFGFWAVGKSIDGFASWGPWIRRDLTEARVLQGLDIIGRRNGEQVQAGNTEQFRFSPSEVLSHISHRISLFPGDVVALGTPQPPPEVALGDRVECDVEGIGVLNNLMVAETEQPPSARPLRRDVTV
jgi:2-keto-4-pentenoate hydratase/2-oxohepta-3-ene-1,7-dioic acid hydratase in catechol pathway